MKLQKRFLLCACLFIFLSAGIASAAGTVSLLPQTQKFIRENCSLRSLTDVTAVVCYLFDKSREQDALIQKTGVVLSPVPGEISDMQSHLTQTDHTFLSQGAVIDLLASQIASLSAVSPVPTPPIKGIWVSIASVAKPSNFEYYFSVNPRIVANNGQQLLSDCWVNSHFSNGDITVLNTLRDEQLKVISPHQVEPSDGSSTPMDLYCSWGGSVYQYHFNAVWDTHISAPQVLTSY